VKKKYTASSKDKKDWINFTRQIDNIRPKEADLFQENIQINKVPRLDLHGFSLEESNKKVKKFIIESSNRGYKKLLVITGKGLRSKSYSNPYISNKLNVLRNSVPEFIKDDEDLKNKTSKVLEADIRDGGEGAIYIFLKNNKKFTE
jgi:DNA-nicking Smr family endonuclease